MRLTPYGIRRLLLIAEILREMAICGSEGANIEGDHFVNMREQAKGLIKELEDGKSEFECEPGSDGLAQGGSSER